VTGTRATAELARVTARILTVVRLAQFAFGVFFVTVWSSWYREDPARWLGPGLMAVWVATFALLAYRRGLTTGLVAGEVLFGVAAGAGTYFLTPPSSRGDAASWVYVAVVTAAVVAAVGLSRRWFVASLVALEVANFAGAPTHRPQVIASTALLAAIALLFRSTYRRLADVAFAADEWLAATFDRRTADAVAHARESDARRQERLIHDTVLNTLTAIGWGGLPDAAVVRSRCGRSVAAMAGLIAGSAEPTDVDLHTAMRAAAAVARESGIRVDLAIREQHAQRAARPARQRLLGTARQLAVPAEVVTALAAAVGEALANVARHARTDRAAVVVELGTGRVVVTVSDEGIGFDPGAAGPARLGLRGSVVGRVADVGGWVDVRSSPGEGTTVRLNWRAPDTAPFDQVDADSLRKDYDAAVRRAAGTIVLSIPLLTVMPLVGFLGLVRIPGLAVVMWVATAAVAGVCTRTAIRRPLSRGEAIGLAAFALSASVVGGLNTTDPHAAVRLANWSMILALPLLTMLVVVSRPAREWISVCLVGSVVVLAVGLGVAGTEPLELARTASAVYGSWTIQFFAAAFGPVLRATATTTSLAAASDVELASRQRAKAMIRRDRAAWVRDLDEQVLPLLRGVADGSFDPADPGIRRRCASRAGVLRRVLAAAADMTSSGLGELEPPIEAAEARGLTVEVRLQGDVHRLPDRLRMQLAAAVAEALRAAVAGPVTLTVFCLPDEGSVYVTYPIPFGAGPGQENQAVVPSFCRADSCGLQVSADVADGVACVELHWELAPA
jgi:signal transduction histidine kinase